jgi:pyridoxal phosphate enzyme (YggS family)
VSTSSETIAERLAAVRERVEGAARRAGRDHRDVMLVAVSKNVEPARIAESIEAGQRVFGENRAQELLAHAAALPGDVAWHFVGRLQRNKVRSVASLVSTWESVDRPELVAAIERHAPSATVLVQVNVGDEPQKGGCAPEATAGLVDEARAAGLRVVGLMAVPPVLGDPRPSFARLRTLAEQLGLPELSMGMSADFEAAIEEGATIVRVGSAIFGPRPTSANARR